MTDVTTFLRAYADQLDGAQRPVSTTDVLSRVEAVRVPGASVRRDDQGWRWRNLAIAGAVAVAFVFLVAAPFVFGRWIEPTDSPPATDTETPTTSAEDTFVRDTAIGRWTWMRLPFESTAQVVAWNGELWAIEADALHPEDPTETRSPVSRLLVSRDGGATWTSSPLPASTDGYLLILLAQEDRLALVGRAASDRFLEFGRTWRSVDGESWEEVSEATIEPGPRVPLDGFHGEGLILEASASSTARFDDVILAHGFVGFDFPREVQEAIDVYGFSEESWNGQNDSDYRIFRYDGEGSADYRIEAERVGSEVNITVWRGFGPRPPLIHSARIGTPTEYYARMAMTNLPFPMSVPALWRSDDGGAAFTLIDDPFRDHIGDASGWFGVESILLRGGGFVAYGRVPAGITTGQDGHIDRGEPGGVGAIATSHDGITWEVSLVDGFDPADVVPYRQGALWNGATNIWVSEDGVSGEVVAVVGDNWGAMGVDDAFIIRPTSTALALSLDGREWEPVTYPQQSAEEPGDVYVTGNAVIYRPWDRASLWIGTLEP